MSHVTTQTQTQTHSHARTLYRVNTPATSAPRTTDTNTTPPGTTPLPTPLAPFGIFNDPLLVLPNCNVDPECPFDVANTDGFTVAVFAVFVYAVVANVTAAGSFDGPPNAWLFSETSANPGAGTVTLHVLAV
jgi:hypothetical protein